VVLHGVQRGQQAARQVGVRPDDRGDLAVVSVVLGAQDPPW